MSAVGVWREMQRRGGFEPLMPLFPKVAPGIRWDASDLALAREVESIRRKAARVARRAGRTKEGGGGGGKASV